MQFLLNKIVTFEHIPSKYFSLVLNRWTNISTLQALIHTLYRWHIIQIICTSCIMFMSTSGWLLYLLHNVERCSPSHTHSLYTLSLTSWLSALSFAVPDILSWLALSLKKWWITISFTNRWVANSNVVISTIKTQFVGQRMTALLFLVTLCFSIFV